MKARILILTVMVLGLAIIFSMTNAFACMCEELTIEQRINRADVIFSGTIKDNPRVFSEGYVTANFDVPITIEFGSPVVLQTGVENEN